MTEGRGRGLADFLRTFCGLDERQELVGYLAGEGMSTRAIAPIVAVDKDTVRRDLIAGGANTPPAQSPPLATPEGVVIAEQRHVELPPGGLNSDDVSTADAIDGVRLARPI